MDFCSSSSGSLSVGTTVVSATGGYCAGAQLIGGSAASTLTIYESPDGTGTGTVIASLSCAINGSAYLPLCLPVVCNKQLVAVVAGAGATAVVHFIAR